MNINIKNRIEGLVMYGTLILSIIFICIGTYRDEVGIVLRKAINICLECIGIG